MSDARKRLEILAAVYEGGPLFIGENFDVSFEDVDRMAEDGLLRKDDEGDYKMTEEGKTIAKMLLGGG